MGISWIQLFHVFWICTYLWNTAIPFTVLKGISILMFLFLPIYKITFCFLFFLIIIILIGMKQIYAFMMVSHIEPFFTYFLTAIFSYWELSIQTLFPFLRLFDFPDVTSTLFLFSMLTSTNKTKHVGLFSEIALLHLA